MRQYLLINTMILPSFHDSGSWVIGLILASGSKQKLHHIANITIFPINKTKYVLKNRLENRFRNSKCIAFYNSTSFQVSCQKRYLEERSQFCQWNINFFNV